MNHKTAPSAPTVGFKLQQCNVPGLALSWLAFPAGIVYFSMQRNWAGAMLWTVGMISLRWALFHYFPSLSRFLGYGRVDDTPAVQVKRAPVEVTFYSFFSCPFCPIVLQRLKDLQRQMDFILTTVDVTLKPQLLVQKGILAVPVVEVGANRLVGNATTAALAAMIEQAQPSSAGSAA